MKSNEFSNCQNPYRYEYAYTCFTCCITNHMLHVLLEMKLSYEPVCRLVCLAYFRKGRTGSFTFIFLSEIPSVWNHLLYKPQGLSLCLEFDLYATFFFSWTPAASCLIFISQNFCPSILSRKRPFWKHTFPMNTLVCLLVGRSASLLVGLCVVISW